MMKLATFATCLAAAFLVSSGVGRSSARDAAGARSVQSPRASVQAGAAPHAMPSQRAASASAATPGARPGTAADALVGKYSGQVEGARGWMTMKRATGEKLAVSIVVASPDCSGSLEFVAAPKSDALAYRGTLDPDTGHQCRMTLKRRGDRISVAEDGCSDHHGQSCSFTGTFRRQRS